MKRLKLLTPDEIDIWVAWRTFSEAVLASVARDVLEATGLSSADYRVLSLLIERDDGRMRQRDLALALRWDKSRISHQLTRMQERDLLTRSKTIEFGSRIELTATGRRVFLRARPAQAEAVRNHLLQRLSPDHVAALLTLARADS